MKHALNSTKLIIIFALSIIVFLAPPKKAFAIVGGTEADAGEQNWMVGIGLASESNGYDAQFCGGTLIADDWVLTAAHCTLGQDRSPFAAGDLSVIINRTTLSSNAGQRIAVKAIIVHANFDLRTYNNDIALLRLEKPVQGAEVLPLATQETAAVNTAIYGWGMTQDGEWANTLKKAQLPIASSSACQQAYDTYGININENMICAGFAAGGTDSCMGDSGGPLVGYEDGKPVQIGIISFGLECGAAGLYGVYTNIANYGDWVDGQITVNN